MQSLPKKLQLAPHFQIYPYVIVNINVCTEKNLVALPPPLAAPSRLKNRAPS